MRKVILVDEHDNELGSIEKLAAHQQALLRAFSVFIWRRDKQGISLLIQQRAGQKYHFGGLWANSCCSHPQPGQSTLAAAQKRLGEELGLSCEGLTELFCFIYQARSANGLVEHEYDHVLLGQWNGAEPQPDAAEIAALRWIPLDLLSQELAGEADKFAPWFRLSAPQVIKYLQDMEQ